jgi:outer membrane protein
MPLIDALKWPLPVGLLCLCLSGPAPAAEPEAVPAPGAPLGWQEAIRTAVDKHPFIKAAEHEALEIQAVVKQVESPNYPQLTGIYANSAGNTRVLANLGISGSLPKPTNYLTTPGARVDFLITDFGRTAHRILSQKSAAAAADKAVLTAKAVAILNVQQAYLNCLKQQRLVDVAQEIMKERDLIRQQTEAFYRRQLRSKLDLDFASVEFNRAEVAWIKAKNDLTLSFAALNTAMGLRSQAVYALDSSMAAPASDIEPEALLRLAMERRPELLGSQDRVQAAEEALKSAKALRFGSISAIGTLGYTWWGREERPSGHEVSNPGAQLGWYGLGGTSSLPLYTGGRIEGQIDEADARRGEVQASTRAIANDIVLQVAQAYLSRLTAQQQITVAEEKVAFAREALTLARERYKTGLGSILDVTTATADLLSAEVQLADAQYEYRASDAALAFATGAEYGRY